MSDAMPSGHFWQLLHNARKAHVFDRSGRSLCGRWFTFAESSPKDAQTLCKTPTPVDCRVCHARAIKIAGCASAKEMNR